MAKWGEGDPRWIVEERPDATNVNNWHWTEKNAGPWSQDRLKELFTNTKVASELADLTLSEVETCTGEASANNRKGKLIFFYEWDIVLKWKGTLNNGTGKEHEGQVKIPNLSEENEVDELDIQIHVKETEGDGQVLKEIMYETGRQVVRNLLAKYISGLKEEFSKGMILPAKDKVAPPVKSTTKLNNYIPSNNESKSTPSSVVQEEGSNLNLTHKFQCTPQEFYDAMTRKDMLTALTRAAVKVEAFEGGSFELFGGNITGKFIELVPAKKIVMKWRCSQYSPGYFSTVTIKIEDKQDHIQIAFTQNPVPVTSLSATQENWDRYYWKAMMQTFGFGSIL